jgi:hypothetical protein
MKQLLLRSATLAAIVLALLVAAQVQSATAPLRLPLVSRAAQFAATITVLVEDDSTFVHAAVAPGGCTFLTYIDRAHGNRLHLVRDAGDHVVEVPLPLLVQQVAREVDPGFVAPGDKQADGALVIVGTRLDLYYTTRDVDDPGGPFKLKRLTMPVPPCS